MGERGGEIFNQVIQKPRGFFASFTDLDGTLWVDHRRPRLLVAQQFLNREDAVVRIAADV